MNRRDAIKTVASIGGITTIAGCTSILGEPNTDKSPPSSDKKSVTRLAEQGTYVYYGAFSAQPDMSQTVNGNSVSVNFKNTGRAGAIKTVMAYGSNITDVISSINDLDDLDEDESALNGSIVVNDETYYEKGESGSFEMSVPDKYDIETDTIIQVVPSQYYGYVKRDGPTVDLEAHLIAYSQEEPEEKNWKQAESMYYTVVSKEEVSIKTGQNNIIEFLGIFQTLLEYEYIVYLKHPTEDKYLRYTNPNE